MNKYEFETLLKELKYEETDGRDAMGMAQGFIEMLDHKDYVSSNICNYDKWNGGNAGNIYFPKVRYVLYYLKQEPNYIQRYPQKTNFKRCDGNCNCSKCKAPQLGRSII